MEYVLMDASHVKQVAELERICFSTPWSERSIASEVTNPLSAWLVAVENGIVVGYVGSQSVLGEADMMNVAVSPDYRRRGIARTLVKKLIDLLRDKEVFCLTLEVRASNEGAIALYDALGFVEVGKRPNYYTSPREDALILRKEWEV